MSAITNEMLITSPNYLVQTVPTPEGSGFARVMDGIKTMAGAAGDVAGILDPTNMFSAVSSLQELVQEQMAIQVAMQQVSFESNVSKSDHEMRMAPIRNLRTS